MLGVLWLTVHFLGADGRSEIAIFNANLALTIILNGFIGSSVIVYLTPRTNFYKLLIPSYVWAIIFSFISPLLIQTLFVSLADHFGHEIEDLHLQNTGYYYLLVMCTFMGSLFEYHYMVLIGKQKMKSAALLNFIRNFVLAIALLFMFYYSGFDGDVYGFFISLTFAYFIGLIISFVLIFKLKESIKELSGFWDTFKQLVRLGFVDQFSNVLQFLNKRIPMYSLFMIFDKAETGVLSVAITLTESFLFLTQSISIVQYSKISNTEDEKFNIRITQKMFRFSFVILTACMLLLYLVPNQLYVFMFKKEFLELNEVIAFLSIGIVTFGSGTIFNHYFSGVGKFQENVFSNLLGLGITISLGSFYLIPNYGIWGAALTPTVSYSIVLIYFIISFKIKTKSSFGDFLPKHADVQAFLDLLSTTFKKKAK